MRIAEERVRNGQSLISAEDMVFLGQGEQWVRRIRQKALDGLYTRYTTICIYVYIYIYIHILYIYIYIYIYIYTHISPSPYILLLASVPPQ